MTYTTESDIEAMAEGIQAVADKADSPHDRGDAEILAKAALAASPVHAELARVKAENERLREALKRHHQWHLDLGDIVFDLGGGETMTLDNAAEYRNSSMCEQTLQALQQKGGE